MRPVGFYEPNVNALRHIMTELGFGSGTCLEGTPLTRPDHLLQRAAMNAFSKRAPDVAWQILRPHFEI